MKVLTLLAAFPPDLFRGVNLNSLSLDDIGRLMGNIIEILLSISGVLALIFILYAGIQYIVSEGNDSKVKSAKDTIQNAVIGLFLAAIAYLVVDFVAGRFQ
jgi:hypothetical protein